MLTMAQKFQLVLGLLCFVFAAMDGREHQYRFIYHLLFGVFNWGAVIFTLPTRKV